MSNGPMIPGGRAESVTGLAQLSPWNSRLVRGHVCVRLSHGATASPCRSRHHRCIFVVCFRALAIAEHELTDGITDPSDPSLIFERLLEIARISALEEMASGMAHELNQPLGAIATFSQAGERMLNRPEPLVQRALDVFRQISTEALTAGEGIRRIRRLFDGGGATRVAYDLCEVIDELRPALEALALKVDGEFKVIAPLDLPRVTIDRLRIQHVLFALVQNAFDASAEVDRPLVTIELASDRYAVQTSVLDVGPGVPAEAQEQLFRPFFTTKQRGTGLGLASSRAIIEAHEGTIGFDNLPAAGSRFWFRLPATR